MSMLRGIWELNSEISWPAELVIDSAYYDENVNNGMCFWSGMQVQFIRFTDEFIWEEDNQLPTTYYEMRVYNDNYQPSYYVVARSKPNNSTFLYPEYATSIDFGIGTYVSSEFYNWFVNNAKQATVIVDGTWRLPATLDLSGTTSHAWSASFKCNGRDINCVYLRYNTSTAKYDLIFEENYDMYFEYVAGSGSSRQTIKINPAYRIIEFNSSSADKGFAEHVLASCVNLTSDNSVDLTKKYLISGATLADIGDALRACKVAKGEVLLSQVPELILQGLKGVVVQQQDIEALGVLCDWEIESGLSSVPTITITNHHPSYYLVCNVTSNLSEISYSDWCIDPDDSASVTFPRALGENDFVQIENIRWSKSEV